MNVLKNRLADILVMSLRPVQLLLSVSALLMAISLLFEYVINDVAYVPFVSTYLVAIAFGLYGVANAYCCFDVTRHSYDHSIRLAAAGLGVLLWVFAFAVEMTSHTADAMIIHLLPICAEAWVLAQLTSKVRQQDRRAL